LKAIYPIIAADVALFTVQDDQLQVLLLRRDNDPYRGYWALPGVVLKPDLDDNLDATARRALNLKSRIEVPHLEQVAVFSGPKRDPRGYSVSIAYFALLPRDQAPAVAGAKTQDIVWVAVKHPKRPLAFDHAQMLEKAVARLRQKVEQSTLPLHLLPARFTLGELQRVCEVILGCRLDKSSFRRRLKTERSFIEIPGAFQTGQFRPAQLYRAVKDFRFQ